VDLFEYQASLLARAADDIAGSLAGLKVDLTKEALPVDGTTTLAEFNAVKADFTGYAQGEVTWLDPSISDDGTVEVVGTIDEWRPTAITVGNDVFDAYFTAAVGGALMFAGQLDGIPVPMRAVTDSLVLTVRYRPADQSIAVQIS